MTRTRSFVRPYSRIDGIVIDTLREFFDNRKEEAGIRKWNHYFTIYDRHFRLIRGQEVCVLEIGINADRSE